MTDEHNAIVNAQLKQYFPIWMEFHESHLTLIRQQLPYWTEVSKEQEKLCNKGRKLCIVFDLDEVIISPLYRTFHGSFDISKYFDISDNTLCPSYPGSKEILQKCRDLGLIIFFVTARSEFLRNHTIKNLTKLNLKPNYLIMRGVQYMNIPISMWKTSIRKIINEEFRIIANIGDQVSDLGDYTDINYLIPHHFYKTALM